MAVAYKNIILGLGDIRYINAVLLQNIFYINCDQLSKKLV